MIIRMVVVLPAPLPPTKPGEAAGSDSQVQRIHGPVVTEQSGQSPGLEHVFTLGRPEPGGISPRAEPPGPPRGG